LNGQRSIQLDGPNSALGRVAGPDDNGADGTLQLRHLPILEGGSRSFGEIRKTVRDLASDPFHIGFQSEAFAKPFQIVDAPFDALQVALAVAIFILKRKVGQNAPLESRR
jgi:hypothetical protein